MQKNDPDEATRRRTDHSGQRVMVSPSLMCADLLNLGSEVETLVSLGVDLLHLDIMDGHYVPNMTLGTDLCGALASAFPVPLDIHLMVDDPDRWGPLFAELGSAGRASPTDPDAASGPPASGNEASGTTDLRPYVTIHPETTWHAARTLESITAAGGRAGIAIDPAHSVSRFSNLLPLSQIVLVMCVSPGYAGQRLLPWTLDTIREAARLREERGLDYRIEVDGNVSWENIPLMIDAGADVLVAGTSSLFDPALGVTQAHARLREMAQSA